MQKLLKEIWIIILKDKVVSIFMGNLFTKTYLSPKYYEARIITSIPPC
jgi:hypothetical protein